MKAVKLKDDHSNFLEFFNSMPSKVKEVFTQMESQALEGFDYKQLADYLKSFNLLGWTFEYYLDAEPYNFRPITENKS